MLTVSTRRHHQKNIIPLANYHQTKSPSANHQSQHPSGIVCVSNEVYSHAVVHQDQSILLHTSVVTSAQYETTIIMYIVDYPHTMSVRIV